MNGPLGLPEPCGRPRLDLACSKCDAWASWIIPSPAQQGMVLGLAGRAGWTGITVGPCLCGGCGVGGRLPRMAPTAKLRGRPRLNPIWLMDELVELRRSGAVWRVVADRASQAMGRVVAEQTIAVLVRRHADRAPTHG